MTASDDSEQADGASRQDRAPRQSVFLSATLERFGSARVTRHRVRDLSAQGMRIDQAGDLARGATVLVAVGVLTAVGATIMWVRDGHAGVRFAEAIDPDEARGRAAIAPRPAQQRQAPSGEPSAGWIPGLGDAYRKR